jgi:hypothetical protein
VRWNFEYNVPEYGADAYATKSYPVGFVPNTLGSKLTNYAHAVDFYMDFTNSGSWQSVINLESNGYPQLYADYAIASTYNFYATSGVPVGVHTFPPDWCDEPPTNGLTGYDDMNTTELGWRARIAPVSLFRFDIANGFSYY